MTRAQAERLVEKLDALADPARGGTEHERAAARNKATAMRARYGLDKPTRPTTHARQRTRRRPAYTAPMSGAAWTFNTATQEHSPNVKVHHYKDRANWRIEITDW